MHILLQKLICEAKTDIPSITLQITIGKGQASTPSKISANTA